MWSFPTRMRGSSVMTRMLPFLPLFIALATSSPFWHSRPTGLMGYRLAAYDEEPRTGMPELFHDKKEFDAYVAALVKAGVIADASFIWWAMRPSLALPTLELRAPDSCTRDRGFHRHRGAVPGAGAAALSRSARSMPISARSDAPSRSRTSGGRSVTASTALSSARTARSPLREMIEQVIEETAADAAALGCTAELERCRTIAAAGTSADAQLALLRGAVPHARPRRGACGGEPLARGDHAGWSVGG